MKKLFIAAGILTAAINTGAQVTQINSNKSLQVSFPLSSTKTILVSDIDSSIWVTDGTLAGTIQISNTIKLEDAIGLLSGKLVFRGSTVATGSELYSTDGTAVGTTLVKDIYSGPVASSPADFSLMNGVAYFTATTLAEGRELWKTNGTNAGTTLVKDIVTGPVGSNEEDNYEMVSNGSYLLFRANTIAEGLELWKSDGTDAGTALLKNINTGADSSSPNNFFLLGSTVLFMAKDATHGEELWKTDGTAAGTVLVKDIYTGLPASTSIEPFPGFSFPLFQGFHLFNNKAYFRAYNGVSTGQVWVTDGTAGGTVLIKDITPGASFPPPLIFLFNAVNLSNKFMFGVSDGATTSELWQSDGTPAGTTLFKAFSFANSDFPSILTNYQYDLNTGVLTTPLFQGNKFFFTATTNTEGRELWISDGTLANTRIVKDINAGTAGSTDYPGYAFTADTLFFSANDGIKGNELWKTDGTTANTVLRADINVGAGSSDPNPFLFAISGKLLIGANNGDNAETDLYVLGAGSVIPPAADPCVGGNISYTSNITGASYQWQVNTGSGFTNITNNATYAGATTVTLQINNAAGNFYGYQYRCNVAGNFSNTLTLKFINTWKGTISNLWNNPANWSCNALPDANTDVIINTGTPVLNANGTCRSISVSAGAGFTANTGFTLQVMH
jgi:ELWxxDGT repeat protein